MVSAMLDGNKIVVVLPAYNAAVTLEQTYREIPLQVVDEVVLVDDRSGDQTVEEARRLGIRHIVVHERNKGYGGNQKTCYDKALKLKGDIIIMLHPDYQYTPKLIPVMAGIIAGGLFPVVIASRILGKGALAGGMPKYKYVSNRILTLIQNLLMNQKLSEYHTGYRAFSRTVLEGIDYHQNSDGFIFDNQMLAQILYAGFQVAEVTCPTKYFKEASSINFVDSLVYGLGVLGVSTSYLLQKHGLTRSKIFTPRR
jgi:glycosyltransferase involved in cell wall biosynthesis